MSTVAGGVVFVRWEIDMCERAHPGLSLELLAEHTPTRPPAGRAVLYDDAASAIPQLEHVSELAAGFARGGEPHPARVDGTRPDRGTLLHELPAEAAARCIRSESCSVATRLGSIHYLPTLVGMG